MDVLQVERWDYTHQISRLFGRIQCFEEEKKCNIIHLLNIYNLFLENNFIT